MTTENMSDKIITSIQLMTGKYGVYDIFSDWVEMMALAFWNQVQFSQKREDRYKDIIKKYEKKEQSRLIELFAWLTEWADQEMTDMLGYIYMHLDISSKHHGQFFTPYHICRMMAKMQKYKEEPYEVNEPTCGAGGNIIALAESMKDQGINYQRYLMAVCQDIDIKAVYMAYVQMNLYGIPAICFQSDTLADPQGINSSTGKMMTIGYMLNMWRRKI